MVKQILYGMAFLLFFGAIAGGVYAVLFRSAPSCFDNRKNGSETGVDCGGACAPCALKYTKEIEVEPIKKFAAGQARTVLLARLKNPNEQYGFRDVTYTFTAEDKKGKEPKTASGHTFVYNSAARGARYVIDTVDVSADDVGDIAMTFSAADLAPAKEFVEPKIVRKAFSTDIAGLKKTLQPIYVFKKDLRMKSKGLDVKALEEFLAKKGVFSKAPDEVFDLDTKLALIAYQKQKRLSPASGMFTGKTRVVVNKEVDRHTIVTVEPGATISINGSVRNEDLADASLVVVAGLLHDKYGLVAGVSKTELANVASGEERKFKLVFPAGMTKEAIEAIDPNATELFVDAKR